MEKKTSLLCRDGRHYDIKMIWNENFKPTDLIFKTLFTASNRETGRALALPKEFATYAIGDPQESLGERVEHYYGGDKDRLISDYVTSSYRRVSDFIERGK